MEIVLRKYRRRLVLLFGCLLVPLTSLASVAVYAVYTAREDTLAASCACISDKENRRNLIRGINSSCNSVLISLRCFEDLPDIRFNCQSTSAWYWIGKVIIFIVSIVDVLIIIVIWGRPFKPTLLSGAALIVAFLCSAFSSEYHVLLFGESFVLIIAWIFTLSFLYKTKDE